MELGLYNFGDLPHDAGVTPALRTRLLIEEIELADQVGLDLYGLGEHHRPDFVVSRPPVVLAAAASRTSRIRLTSAVTVLSSEDPVRAFQDFATLDLISNGRAELMAGRGSFTESFPLFGYDLRDYDELFSEKLDLLLALRDHERVTWSGRHRAALDDQLVLPRPVQDRLPIWIAVGGNPQSVVRAGTLGLPMALAIIGGEPVRFAPLAQLHRDAARQAGHSETPALSINTHGFVADTSQRAADLIRPGVARMMNQIARERGFSPWSEQTFRHAISPAGAQMVGSPAQVAEKILAQYEIFGHQRYVMQLSGSVAHNENMRAIELFGAQVAPVVRQALAPVPA